MTKKELFKQYQIDESHNKWSNATDNWIAIDIYREMHNGELPGPDKPVEYLYILEFLDKTKDGSYFFSLQNPGSMFLTAKRSVYRYADEILKAMEEVANKYDAT